MNTENHLNQIMDQFAMQAERYTAIKSHADSIEKLITITGASADDTVLDMACGSGLVAIEFAKKVTSVVGIDITPQMLEQAKKLQDDHQLKNLKWVLGDISALPFENDSFSIVISRFAFHHFINPGEVLSEMIRVCKPNGTVMVADVALPAAKLARYNEMEKLRDSSHVAALSTKQFDDLFGRSGLRNRKKDSYEMQIDLEDQLNASFSENKEQLKTMISKDAGIDDLGVNVTKTNGSTQLFYPIHIFAGTK